MELRSRERHIHWLALVLPPSAMGEAIHVRNTLPAKPPRTIRLEELWRAGGDDGDLLFGTVDWGDEEDVSSIEIICCRMIDL